MSSMEEKHKLLKLLIIRMIELTLNPNNNCHEVPFTITKEQHISNKNHKDTGFDILL